MKQLYETELVCKEYNWTSGLDNNDFEKDERTTNIVKTNFLPALFTGLII